MDRQNNSVMNQRIFKMNLSVETVSMYLLCCNLADTGQTLSSGNIRAIWNGTEKSMRVGIEALIKRDILCELLSDRQGNSIYQLVDAAKWRASPQNPKRHSE